MDGSRNIQIDIKKLVAHLESNGQDKASWEKLARLYELQGDKSRVAYCRLHLDDKTVAVKKVRNKFTVVDLTLIILLIGAVILLGYCVKSLLDLTSPSSQKPENVLVEHPPKMDSLMFAPMQNAGLLQELLKSNKPADDTGNTVYLKGFPSNPYLTALNPSMISLVVNQQKNPQGEPTFTDPEFCTCSPGDDPNVKKVLASTTDEVEESAILYSALQSFYNQYNKVPNNIGELTNDYPNNILPGTTPEMKKAFDSVKKTFLMNKPTSTLGEIPKVPIIPPKTSVPVTPHDVEPIQIIVDTKAHRLAVVSGNVILRNYPVGLGGDKTPEKTFTISEKVKNPNNRDDGDFGSRGMALSDTLYAIHGTNEPDSIGKDESHGCIRMLNADIEELYDMIPKGTPVTIQEGGLPSSVIKGNTPFSAPSTADENSGKIYKWLN